jgi:nicotinamidase-related amidase
MQRDFVHPEHEFAQVLERLVPGVTEGYFQRVSFVVPNAQRLLAAFRACGAPVFFTGTGTQFSDGRDLCCWLRDFDALGLQVLGKRVWPRTQDTAWQIDESVAPLPGEMVVNKTAADPLGCTAIDQSLRNLGVTTVVVAGLTTDVCVSSAARAWADRSYRTIIAEDACTTLSPKLHETSLDIFRLAFGQVKRPRRSWLPSQRLRPQQRPERAADSSEYGTEGRIRIHIGVRAWLPGMDSNHCELDNIFKSRKLLILKSR